MIAEIDIESESIIIIKNSVFSTISRDSIQRDWVPFNYQNNVLFYTNFNLNKVMDAHGGVFSLPNGGGLLHHRASVFFQQQQKVELPWREDDYGERIRGGTPAVQLNAKYKSVYLSFFYSTVFNEAWSRETYFMGAITFCSHPPFNIHAMSMYPIVIKEFYSETIDMEWFTEDKSVDYVVFPAGIVLDSTQSYVVVSIGWQNRDAFIIKMNVDELMETLEFVASCR
jgi:hypothetical protein